MGVSIHLTSMTEETNFAPLGVLGYCLTQTNFLAPVWAGLEVPLKTVDHSPVAKLQDILVSILAGCRAISHVNTRLRPDLALAQAWGRACFADQSMLARTLDICQQDQVAQLRQGSEAWVQREGATFRHDFTQSWLYLDIDLTPLPSSKDAEASTKGKFEKKTAMVGNWLGFRLRSITKRCFRGSIRANRIVARPTSRSWLPWKKAWLSHPNRSNGPFCVRMPGLAVMPI